MARSERASSLHVGQRLIWATLIEPSVGSKVRSLELELARVHTLALRLSRGQARGREIKADPPKPLALELGSLSDSKANRIEICQTLVSVRRAATNWSEPRAQGLGAGRSSPKPATRPDSAAAAAAASLIDLGNLSTAFDGSFRPTTTQTQIVEIMRSG